jgi:hypothetical protein
VTESQKLSALRDKLIRPRRALVEGIQATGTGQSNVMTWCGSKMKSKRWSAQWRKRRAPNFTSERSPAAFDSRASWNGARAYRANRNGNR